MPVGSAATSSSNVSNRAAAGKLWYACQRRSRCWQYSRHDLRVSTYPVTTLTVVTFGSVWLRTRDQPYAPKLNRVVITAIPTRTRRYVIVEPANEKAAQRPPHRMQARWTPDR